MKKAKRLGALNKFKAGECNVLICTDVASRGLDIPLVDMVINYEIPTNPKVCVCTTGMILFDTFGIFDKFVSWDFRTIFIEWEELHARDDLGLLFH